jgi:O-antigen/teichoic acid export membrane protein
MRRLLAQTSAIQSIGVVLMLATTLLVSRFGGPATQGSFALVKSFNDLQVAIFSFGIPPALVIMLNRMGRGHLAVERSIYRYGAVLLLALPPLNLLVLQWTGSHFTGQTEYLQAILIGFGSGLLTIFALLRALLLVHTDGSVFSIVSILHWIVIFLASAVLLNRTPLIFEIAYFAAGLVTVGVIIPVIRHHQSPLRAQTGADMIDWRLLRSQSAHVLVQTVLFGLQPFLTNAVLARADPSLATTGLFNVSSLVITLPNVLVALVAPVLLNRWSKTLDWNGYLNVRRHALLAGLVAQVLALAAIPLIGVLLRLFFGPAFAVASVSMSILLLSVFAVVAGRILTPAMQGLGHNDMVSWSCVTRVAAIAVATAVLHALGQTLLVAFAVGWAAGEYAALLFLIASGRWLNATRASFASS